MPRKGEERRDGSPNLPRTTDLPATSGDFAMSVALSPGFRLEMDTIAVNPSVSFAELLSPVEPMNPCRSMIGVNSNNARRCLPGLCNHLANIVCHA